MNEISVKIELAQAIIFDLGGVVVDLDISRTIQAFEKIGLSSLTRQIGAGHHQGILARLEKGLISVDEFFNDIRLLSGNRPTVAEIESAWNAMLVQLPAVRVLFLEKLKAEKPIILLSNTNSVHHRYFDGMAEGYSSLSHLFDKVWYSYQMNLSKPDPAIFSHLLDFHGLHPENVLFVDDSNVNIEAAAKLGMVTWHVKEGYGIDDFVHQQQ